MQNLRKYFVFGLWILAIALICVVALQACAEPTPGLVVKQLDSGGGASSMTLIGTKGEVEVYRVYENSLTHYVCYLAVEPNSLDLECP